MPTKDVIIIFTGLKTRIKGPKWLMNHNFIKYILFTQSYLQNIIKLQINLNI